MRIVWSGLLAALLVVTVGGASAQSSMTPEQFVASLNFRDGEVGIPGTQARLRLGQEFRFLPQADARRVLEDFWGNPPDVEVLGLVVPRSPSLADDASWAVVVTYADDGYVSDEDATKIDYDQMLADMKRGTAEENDARREAGYDGIELIGWAAPPRYDAVTKKLHWAQELAFEGSDTRTLNYDIRVLGRRGYLSLNAVSNMGQLADVEAGMQRLLPMVEFDAGARYADYDAGNDKVAGYGLAALVGGGLAAKTGLFAKLGALLLAGKKFIVLLVLGIAGFAKYLFGRKGRNDKAV